jgi:hypothetical protein
MMDGEFVTTSSVTEVYQIVCNRHMQERRRGRRVEADKLFDLACALENAFPEEIEAYKRWIGAD